MTCPFCGERDRREFTVQGDDTSLHRPDRDAGAEAWHDYVHLRDNRDHAHAHVEREVYERALPNGGFVLEPVQPTPQLTDTVRDVVIEHEQGFVVPDAVCVQVPTTPNRQIARRAAVRLQPPSLVLDQLRAQSLNHLRISRMSALSSSSRRSTSAF